MAKKHKKYIKPFKNIYVLSLIGFAIWMLFFDAHSWLLHHDLNKDIESLENEKAYYKSEMKKDKKSIDELSTEKGLEKMAREIYYMKKPDEDIFIIEYEDSTKTKEDNE